MGQILETLELKSQKINLDFTRNRYVSVTAKQYDINSRYIIIQFTNNGELVKLTSNYKVEIRMTTPDKRVIVDDTCSSIQEDGTVLLTLTDNMLHKAGRAVAEVRLYQSEEDNVTALSPMNFYVAVIESPCSEEEILSSPDGVTLVNLYKEIHTDYTYVITESRTYASLAEESESNAYQSALLAAASEKASKTSEVNAKSSEDKAKISEDNAKVSETNALESENTATNKATIATNKADEASNHANLSKSYAIGTNGDIRTNDQLDNAKYYCNQAKIAAQSVTNVVYMGTIKFSELSKPENQITSYLFNISDSFVTDSSFKQGAGHSYSAGTSVCRTGDGYWDVMVRITPIEAISATEPHDQHTGDYWLLEY